MDPIKDEGRVTYMKSQSKPSHPDTDIERWYGGKLSDNNPTDMHLQQQVKEVLKADGTKNIHYVQEPEKIVNTHSPADSQMNGQAMGASAIGRVPDEDDIEFWQPKPPKVLMSNPRDIPLEMHSQIHMYAATE